MKNQLLFSSLLNVYEVHKLDTRETGVLILTVVCFGQQKLSG